MIKLTKGRVIDCVGSLVAVVLTRRDMFTFLLIPLVILNSLDSECKALHNQLVLQIKDYIEEKCKSINEITYYKIMAHPLPKHCYKY